MVELKGEEIVKKYFQEYEPITSELMEYIIKANIVLLSGLIIMGIFILESTIMNIFQFLKVIVYILPVSLGLLFIISLADMMLKANKEKYEQKLRNKEN